MCISSVSYEKEPGHEPDLPIDEGPSRHGAVDVSAVLEDQPQDHLARSRRVGEIYLQRKEV